MYQTWSTWVFHIYSFLSASFLKNTKRRIYRYGFPLVLIFIIFSLKYFFHVFFGSNFPFLLLSLVVILSSWYGGLGPGIFATILSGLLNDFLFLTPRFTLLGSENIESTVIFILEGLLVSIISEARRQANKRKDDFLSFVSHELKNPLTTIKGYADIIQKKADKSNEKNIANAAVRINAQTDKIATIVNDLLDIVNIESGKFHYAKEPFLFYELVREVVDEQRVITNSHKILFKGISNKVIYADRKRIGQVLTNLITNAIKYSPSAKEIIVELKNARNNTIISVRDFGLGIPEKQQEKIFNPYYRGSAEKGNIQGLGLGLYISSQIVKKHDGQLRVSSKPGKGSTFYLKLPTTNNS